MKLTFNHRLSIGATALLFFAGAVTAYAGWHPDRGSVKPTPTLRKTTPQAQYLHNNGITSHDTRINHARVGLAPTPRTPLRPGNLMKSPQAPRGNIYGVVNRFQGIQTTGEAYFGKLDLATGEMQRMYTSPLYSPYANDDYLLQTNTLRQGEIICPSVMMADNYLVTWDFIDFESGDYLRTLDFGSDMFANPYSMTYDPDNDLIYMVCIDGNSDGQFSVADPKNDYEITYIGNLRSKGGFIAAIVYNTADHQLYAFNNFNSVYTVDPKKGTLIEAGYLEIPTGELLFEEGVSGQVTYSPADEMFICIYRDNSIQASRILYIHPETFEVFEGEVVTADKTPYITSIFCNDDYATPDAPELAPAILANFDKASLSGSVTITAPTYTYAGVALGSSKVRMVLTVDGKEVYNAEMAPATTATVPLTLEQCEHELQLCSYLGSDRSPVRSMTLYTGNDNPAAPTELKLEGDILSWTAPGAVGTHGGYVDTSALTYDVYLDGKLQNTSPVTATSLKLATPADFDLRRITVVAHANGMDSPEGTLKALFGTAMELPFHQAPTADQTRFYTVLNVNHDERTWFYTSKNEDNDSSLDPTLYGWCYATGYMTAGDDWLFLPTLNIPDPSQLYTLTYSISGIFTLPTSESYEVWIGKAATPEAMHAGTCILDQPNYIATVYREELELNFGVAEAGSYVIGFHATGSPANESQGILISDLDVRRAGESSVIPADPTNVEVKAADMGRNSVEVSLTMPTLDLAGKTLPATESLTLTVSEGPASVTATGLPGAKVQAELEVDACGYHVIALTPSNERGEGYTRNYRLYVGIDRPLAPRNLLAEPSADNLSLHMTWDAPSTVGENKGYVDPNGLTYKVYARSESNSAMLMGETTDREYTVSPFSTSVPALTPYSFGIGASNEGGESYNTQYTVEHLGTPYELPMLEEFGNQGFNYYPYSDFYEGRSMTAWENVGGMDGLGVGNPTFIQGGLVAYATTEGSATAKIILPKASTAGISKANFILRYWDYPSAPDIQVYGRRYGQTKEEYIGEFNMEHTPGGRWVNAEMPLPAAYMNSPWIEVRLSVYFPGNVVNEYFIIDSFQFFPDADYDLKVTSLTGPEQICIGETAQYKVSVANSGRERLSGILNVEIADATGKVYAKETTAVPNLTSNQVFEFDPSFDINGAFRDIEGLKVTARVECDDENLANNTRSIPVKVQTGTLPVVNDLDGKIANEGGVQLSWSVPPTQYGDFENFETHTPFQISEQLDMWQNFDLDGLNPIGLNNSTTGQNLEWDGSDLPQGWTVVDIAEIGYMNDERLAPHSGTKVLMARAGDYPDDDDPIQSSKWLISPEIIGGTELSFWMSTIASDCMEFIEVWYSETDTKLDPDNATSTRNGSFRRARTFSKEGTEAWELIQCALPAKAKYFAIRYCSYDGAAVVIDDILFTPAKMLNREIDHYAVYRADNGGEYRCIANDVTGNTYLDTTWADSDAYYYVAAVAHTEDSLSEGPRSNLVFIGGSAVDQVNANEGITAQPGAILFIGLEGETFTIASTDGKVVATGKLTEPRQIVAAEPGIYVVSAGSHSTTLRIR